MTDVHSQCGGFDEAGCTLANTDGLCQWESVQPDNFQGAWMPHCAPTPTAQGSDCFSLNNRFDCDNSDNCNNADYLGFVTVDIYKNLNSIPYNDPYSVTV